MAGVNETTAPTDLIERLARKVYASWDMLSPGGKAAGRRQAAMWVEAISAELNSTDFPVAAFWLRSHLPTDEG